jgi:hypothetical protein
MAASITKRYAAVAAAGALSVALTSKGVSSSQLGQQLLDMLHITSFSVWFGASVWVTFVGGVVMFYTLPRHTFGLVQSKCVKLLFPRHVCLVCLQ